MVLDDQKEEVEAVFFRCRCAQFAVLMSYQTLSSKTGHIGTTLKVRFYFMKSISGADYCSFSPGWFCTAAKDGWAELRVRAGANMTTKKQTAGSSVVENHLPVQRSGQSIWFSALGGTAGDPQKVSIWFALIKCKWKQIWWFISGSLFGSRAPCAPPTTEGIFSISSANFHQEIRGTVGQMKTHKWW